MKMKKKEASQKTKIVIRGLPPSLSQSHLFSQFDHLFSHRYNWFRFHPGKPSQKHQRNSRAYIDFKSPADVLEFAEFFHGHIFVNEKGARFKAIVEYAPSQHVPKSCARKDSLEGTIFKEPDYLEFIKLIASALENLPSAEVQLERKEAEQSGAEKETPTATPLMEFVRKKRAAEAGTQGLSAVKISRRGKPASLTKHGASITKQSFAKKKYIPKDGAKNMNKKDKHSTMVAPRREDHPATSRGKQVSENQSLMSTSIAGLVLLPVQLKGIKAYASHVEGSNSKITLHADSGMKKILLKGKKRDISLVPEGMLQPSGQTYAVRKSSIPTAPKQSQRRKTGEKLMRSILLDSEAHQSKALIATQPEQKFQSLKENGNRPPQATNAQVGFDGPVPYSESGVFISDGDAKKTSDDKLMKKNRHGLVINEKGERRTRNKDVPVRLQGLEAPLQYSDVTHGELKEDKHHGLDIGEATGPSSGSNSSFIQNGSNIKFSYGGKAHNLKEGVPTKTYRGRSFERGGAIGSIAHQKQVWVQKSTSGS